MTREEVIAQLKMDRDLCNFNPMTGEEEPMNEDCRKSADALDIAIKAIEQQPCEDAVSRQAVLNKKNLVELEDGQSFYCISPEDVETLPTVTPTSKASEWQQDHAILKAHSDGANEVIDRIKEARKEMQKLRGCSCSCSDGIIDDVEDIIDKLIAEVEGTSGTNQRG